MVRSRYAAALIHLGISLAVLACLFAVVFFLWYPSPFFAIAGAEEPALLLVAVDLVLGPLLTLIVYRIGKPELKFDLGVIVVVQLAALLYGASALWSVRPALLVFDAGKFQVVTWPELEDVPIPSLLRERLSEAGPLAVWAAPEYFFGGPDVPGMQRPLMPVRTFTLRPLQEASAVLRQTGTAMEEWMAGSESVARAMGETASVETLAGTRAYPVYGRNRGWSAVVLPGSGEIVGYVPEQAPRAEAPEVSAGRP